MNRVVVVEDETMARKGIILTIDWSALGCVVVGEAANGEEGAALVERLSPDIVVTDIRMPGLSGLELIEKISQTDLNIQFILLSGFGEFEYAKQAMRFRVHHYLLKPCNEDQIIESMQDVIKEHFHQKAFQDMQERQKNLVTNLH